MKKSIMAFILLLPLGLLASTSGWFTGSLAGAESAAKPRHKDIVIEFHALW